MDRRGGTALGGGQFYPSIDGTGSHTRVQACPFAWYCSTYTTPDHSWTNPGVTTEKLFHSGAV